jgi:hypothetical protein
MVFVCCFITARYGVWLSSLWRTSTHSISLASNLEIFPSLLSYRPILTCLSLLCVCVQVAEDPQEGTQLQLPHLKGQAVEEMLNAVYRRYCG